jgi:hypothetical protein
MPSSRGTGSPRLLAGLLTLGTCLVALSGSSWAQGVPPIFLNEVHARPATGAAGDANGDGIRDGSQDEFVEIVNAGTNPVDVSGYVLATGASSTAPRFTFPAGAVLLAGGRGVVFGGGLPGGSFGGAAVFASSGLVLVDAPAATYTVELLTAATGGTVVDSLVYDSATFGSSCTTTCASVVRSPEGTGAFVSHTTVSGSSGILWSPGVVASAAIPKVNERLSVPPARATDQSVLTPLRIQFNMYMQPADITNALLKLYLGPCAAPLAEVPLASVSMPSPLQAELSPAASLQFGTTYCAAIEASVRSAAGTPLASDVRHEFTTRPATSRPASTVVISEYGGASFAANDEFVELHNPTASPVDVSGWMVQRRSAGGSSSCWATLPAGLAPMPAWGYLLIGGSGFTPTSYAGAPSADYLSTTGTTLTGASESLLLIGSSGTCTGTGFVMDSISSGTVTDASAALLLPPYPTSPGDGHSLERKACYDSTGDTNGSTGMVAPGGHASAGNDEKLGASNADWALRPSPGPQNSGSAVEIHSCDPGPPFDRIFRDGFQ